jgi:uncharacterized cupin superfamily protein
MPKIDIANLETDSKTGYPEPFRQIVLGRVRKQLGNAAGLTQFGVNLTTLKPGAASAQRHWHAAEDEFVYVLAGEVVLCEDGSEVMMGPGDAAGFKAGVANGHCLINRSERDAIYLEVGTRAARERAEYPDINLRAERDESGMRYLHKSGEPYRGSER